jgi:mannose-1-phosphate guanylyltransferase
MRYAMIMAGGAGTRLWPMSRKGKPKQLLRFIHSRDGSSPPRSLIEIAADRLEGLVPAERRFICTAEAYRAAIRADLPTFSDERILGEPMGRDTVNAVGFAAAVLSKLDPDAVFAVLTADHIIEPVGVFRERVELGFRLVEADPRRLVTFSIKPTYPATGFGYVERGRPVRGMGEGVEGLAFHVERFVEKPDRPRAEAYVRSGVFGWNSGMFVWKASTFLECLERFKPESHEGLMRIRDAWGGKDQRSVLEGVYPTLPKISVDYAVMEPASKAASAGDPTVSVCTVLMDLSWLDVGSWPAYAQTLGGDEAGNRVAGPGATLVVQGRNNLVVNATAGHTVTVLGGEGLVVVHTADATLVMPLSKAEELKALHARVEEGLR